MDRRGWKSTAAYVALLAAAFVAAVAASWIFGPQVENFAYDRMFATYEPAPWKTQSVVLAIDERTLGEYGGITSIREPLAAGLRILAGAAPKVVAVDLILADRGGNPRVNAELADALCATPNLVLSAELMDDGWEKPRPEFLRCHPAIGHVYAQPDSFDSRTRAIALEKTRAKERLWALSLEAFRLSRGVDRIEESWPPTELRVGTAVLPIPDIGIWQRHVEREDGRLMRIRFLPDTMQPIPRISLAGLIAHPERARELTGKVVFVGLTAITGINDRLFTPKSTTMPTSGIEINAEAFETMAQGLFLQEVAYDRVLLFSLILLAGAGLSFRYLPGWWAYLGGLCVLAAAVVVPYVFFTHRHVLSVATPVSVAWFGTLTAAAYYHLVVRRNWRIEQASRTRYQQAMQFVTHEMRTPLSAIQGSSELISRYALTDEKRTQLSLLINSESKRLARMVEVFLSVERLSAGQMELKREPIAVKQMVEICLERAKPLAERKKIGVTLEPIAEDLQLTGDRELMEYACYNLLTNAIKYSPQQTEVTVSVWKGEGHIRIAVKDQGIGMDHKEVKQIFQKFYRTKKAEASGEAGTGIGLSIVQQIVEQHGGQIEVTSKPGVGSCFTLVLPVAAVAPLSTIAERH